MSGGYISVVLSCQDRELFAQDERGGFQLRAVGIEVPVKDGFLLGQLHVYANSRKSKVLNSWISISHPKIESAAAILGDVIGRPPLERPGDGGSYKLMNNWLASCLAHHEECRRTISNLVIDETAKPALPTRVIQIRFERSNALLRLVETGGQHNAYIALSHCWGDETRHPLKTTSCSLEAHLVNIPHEQLPKTFQDAVAITRALGVHYLWIDSLCIIQDDLEDWRRESCMMGLIYERAKLTIAARHASSSREGCFSQREALSTVVELPHIDKLGIHRGSIFTTMLPSECKGVDENLSPLNKRAWTTQEWLLSRRMILCLKDCLAWSCKTITQVETGSTVAHIGTRDSSWESVVERFSMRDLTFLSDRLTALEGVKNELQKQKTDYETYACGLWHSGLPCNLLWFAKSRANRMSMPLHIPSWSWASTICGVQFIPYPRHEKELVYCTAAFIGKESLFVEGRIREAPHILDLALSTNVDPISKSIIGSASFFSGVPAYLICDDQREPIGFAIFDEYQRSSDRPVYCLAITRESYRYVNDGEDGHTFFILLLRNVPGPTNTYTRIGIGSISPPYWFAHVLQQNFNII